MTTTTDRPAPTVRELIHELARTEDALRARRGGPLGEQDLRVVRRQAAVVRELRRRRADGHAVRPR